MDMMDVAKELVAGCREDRARENLDKLYAPDAVSVEAADMGNGRETTGLDGIKGKHDWWESEMEMLDSDIIGPLPHGDDRFAVIFRVKVKEKATGKVSDMEEVGVYTVKGGKIVREEFFYAIE
ncbi:SnoaL-like domain protein [Roseovarius sp. THAF9]|uniref:nuclear transport factor 2 family protein n=1 Tax=Roseovarius sp. THAF9 TaxID=2587847 RepID=UPI001268A439|nr:nuclear transport factor 2 family protein [Roseovarius sp. THAF9]QFT92712.1 SnoaL-like domain protein [Roseovarius sp. THAF9]